MSQTIEVNIADVLAKLDAKIDKLDSKIDKLEDKIDKLSNDMARLEGKVTGIDKRVENLEFIARTISGGVVVALLLGLAKFLFPNFSI